MKGWIIGTIALLGAASAQGQIKPGWLRYSLPGGAELLYVPVAVTWKDYPKQALRAESEGTSLLNLQVGTSGRLLRCTIARSSGSPLLDEQACRLYFKRGRFELSGTSRPVTVQAPVTWLLGD